MDKALKHKNIAIFGATGRIGQDVSVFLAEHGANLAIHYNRQYELAENIVKRISNTSNKVFSIQCDVENIDNVHNAMKEINKRLGSIDAVVNLVHKDKEFVPTLIKDMTWEDNWMPHIESMRIHFNICKEVLPYMRQQQHGRIIYLSGGLAFRFFNGCSPFSATKAAMNAFCKALALEEGKNNVTVNIIAPGKVIRAGDSPTDVSGEWKEMEEKQLQNIPLGRFCSPIDVANAIMMLLLPGSSYITGQTIYLTGGEIMPMP